MIFSSTQKGKTQMAILKHLSSVSSDQFTYVPQSRHLIADRSDLNGLTTMGRLYDDACDVGFWVRSTKTGNEVAFALTHEVIDRVDGDVLYWDFIPIPEHARCLVRGLVTVRVYND